MNTYSNPEEKVFTIASESPFTIHRNQRSRWLGIRTQGYETLRQAVESALEMGSCDVSTVWYLMTAGQLDRAHPEPIDVGLLSCYERPLPVLTEYDQLLTAAEVMP